MAVVVFDADVVIAYLNRDDAHHERAIERMRAALDSQTRRLLSAVNYSEVLIGPLRRGAIDTVETMISRLAIEVIAIDAPLARTAAEVRARRGLKLPDAYAVAVAIKVEETEPGVRVESFDKKVVKAFAAETISSGE